MVPYAPVDTPQIEMRDLEATGGTSSPVTQHTPRAPDPVTIDPINPITNNPEPAVGPGTQVTDRDILTIPCIECGVSSSGISGSPIYDRKALDQQPVATHQVAPDFPRDLKNAGIAGTVVVDFVLEADGHVSGASASSATHQAFADSAVRAVLRWRFHPGRVNGRNVRTHMSVPISFTLEDQ